MALVLADRVQQTGTANTTVSFTLSGSVTGFQSFSVVGNTNTTYYSATDASGNWETGLGTYSTTGPTLTRTTVYQSSNSNAAVTFAGTVNVFVTYPAGRNISLDASGNATALGTPVSGNLANCTFPTLNQNTTGSAGSVANALTINSPLTGTSFNGSSAVSIGIPAATTSVSGYLTSTDWNTFNGKQPAGSYLTSGGALGTPSSGTLTNCTFPTLNQNTTGSSGSCTGNAASATTLTNNATITGLNFGGTFALTGSGATTGNSTGMRLSENYGALWDGSNGATWHHQMINGSYLSGFLASGGNYGNGNYFGTGNVIAYYSDERLKTKVKTIDSALEKVLSLEGFIYVENELARSVGYTSEKEQAGLSAQKVQKVLPQAVSLAPFDMQGVPETGEIISKSGENYLTVDYSRIVPLLVEAIKELEAQVAKLKGK
jgi:hypothetical protein